MEKKDLKKGAKENLYLSEKELKEVLELALKKQLETEKPSEGKVNFEYVKEAALQLGLTNDVLTNALQGYHLQKEERKRKYLKFSLAILSVLLVFLLYWNNTRTRFYTDPIKVVLAHGLTKKKDPIKESSQFGLNQKEIYLHITWIAIKKGNYDISYKWKGPEDELIFLDRYVLTAGGSSHRSWSSYSPKKSDPEGKWSIEVTLDKMIVGKYSFTMERSLSAEVLENESLELYQGETDIVYTLKMKDNQPTDIVTQINLGQTVTCHITWYGIEGEHTIKWKWIWENKDLVSTEILKISPNRATWRTWDPYTPEKTGNYKTRIYIDEAFVKELELKVVKK